MTIPDPVDKITISSVVVKGYRLMIKADPIEEVTEGGILLVLDKKLEKAGQNMGTVVSIGPLCWTQFPDETPWCKLGDRIVYSRYAGKFIMDPVTEEEYLLLNDEDVIATIEDGIHAQEHTIEEIPNGQ